MKLVYSIYYTAVYTIPPLFILLNKSIILDQNKKSVQSISIGYESVER